MIAFSGEATLYTDQTTNPTIPAAGAGPSISGLKSGGRAPANVQVEIKLGATGTTVTLPGPVKVYIGRDGSLPRYAGMLNGGAAITVDTTVGYQEMLYGVALGDRMAIVAGGALTGGGGFDAIIKGVVNAP